MADKFLTTATVAAIRHVKPKSLSQERWRGNGPPWIKCGRGRSARILYLAAQLAEWLRAQPSGGGQDAPRVAAEV